MKKGTCRHFTGTCNATCEAGVNYRELVGGPDLGWGTRLPCMAKYAKDGAAPCVKREEPTAEEIAADEAEWQKHVDQFKLTLPLISDMKKRYKGKSAQEVKECPVCKGKLHLSISGYNGHVWGKCETEGCLAWME